MIEGLIMRIYVTKNKTKDIISLKYKSLKYFDFTKINEILHIDKMFTTNNLDAFLKGHLIDSKRVNQIVNDSKNHKNIWNIIFYDTFDGVLDEIQAIDYLKKNKIRIYIDINLSENEAYVLINQISFNFNVIDVMKEKNLC
ncbi:MAG: hypothetical protein WC154_01805 [Candidatus Izemoplasmatales bacterium]